MLPLAEIGEDGCSVPSAGGTGAGTDPGAGTASGGVEGVAKEWAEQTVVRTRNDMRKIHARPFTGYLLGDMFAPTTIKLICGYIGL